VLSAKGALVTNIAHIPEALSAVMRENATRPDFAPEGNLALKAWFGADRDLDLPPALKLPVVAAVAPYNEQIAGTQSADRRSASAPVDERHVGCIANGLEVSGDESPWCADARGGLAFDGIERVSRAFA
jgi:hypothetical protein